MNELVIMKDQQAVTSSLQVAEVFQKSHKHVLEAIDSIVQGLAENSADPKMFVEGTYQHPQNKQNYRVIYMNRDGFTLLAMGFSGKKALQFKLNYISAFNEMEKHWKQIGQFQVPADYTTAMRLAADQQEQIKKLQPKANYFDQQMHNPGLLTTTVIAKGYGRSAYWLNQWLSAHHVIYRQGKNWIVRSHFADKGYASYENWSDSENKHVHPLLKWTQKGQKFIYDCLAAEGILPINAQMSLETSTGDETNAI
ncbi:Rha family transcriptional regulator [Paucilactobacillus sp. N302-9]